MAAAPGQATHQKRSALIVDDSKLACAVLSRLLEQEGYDIDLAGSGHEALQRVREQRPDLIFMDHLMPGMTGLDAVRALKADQRTVAVPVVMFSSQEDDEFLAAAREAGASAVLTKHTERTNLGQVLASIGQQQERLKASPAVAALGVGASRAAPPLRPAAEPRPVIGLTRADLRAEIEPMLRAQRDQIHTELLAEFAILEGHQESMRRTLTGRLETLLHRTVREVTEQLAARLAPPAISSRQSLLGLLGRAGLATAALALLAIPVALVVEQGQRLERMSAATADLRAAVDHQSRAMGELGRQVEGLGQQVAATAADLQVTAAATEAALRREQQQQRLPAAAPAMAAVATPPVPTEPRVSLAELLAASGIEGAIELRTAQGSFCLELQGSRSYRLTPMGTTGSACGPGSTLAVLAGVTPDADRAY
jgi:CheY-like chemotaxis protein